MNNFCVFSVLFFIDIQYLMEPIYNYISYIVLFFGLSLVIITHEKYLICQYIFCFD